MPSLAVVIPAYQSQATVAATLDSLLVQSRPADEIVLVDSSPDDATGRAVQPYLDRITYIRSRDRLYPHEARNLGASRSCADLLVFTDPDIVAHRDWLATLESAYEALDDVIVGSVDCHGRRLADVGVHLCKFDSWLPGGPARTVEIGPSVNLMIPRTAFEQVGGFPDDPMLGDTTLSWALAEAGHRLWFEPCAVVAHDHVQNARSLYRERFRRGREFGFIRMERDHWPWPRIAAWWLVSALPVRLFKLLTRRVSHCASAGWLRWLALTWPWVLIGEAGWVWGESAAYWARLRRRS
jgi:GT2 family glycosyltransferase